MNRRKAIITGGTLSGATLLSVFSLKWYKTTYVVDLSVLKSQESLIADLAECIIPETDTPGAKSAAVEKFIMLAVINCSDMRTQRNFIKGLNDLQAYTMEKYNKIFLKCDQQHKEEILAYFEARSYFGHSFIKKVKKKIFGEPFFSLLKNYTAIGYCTSMQGATKGLSYDYIPSTFQPCLQITENQRSWATK